MTTYSGRLAAKLRQLRDRSEMSVTEVVKKINRAGIRVSDSTYYDWEGGRLKPNLDAMPALAEIFGFNHTRSVLPED